MSRVLFLFAVLAGCVDSGDDITLENSSDGGKADSVVGKRISVSITNMVVVTSGPSGCSQSGGSDWTCGGNVGQGSLDVFVNRDSVGLRGVRVMPQTHESFYVFEAKNEGFGLPNYRNVTYGQLIYARTQQGSVEWSLLHCPKMNYFSSRVTVDIAKRTIEDASTGIVSTLDACGAPAGAIEVASFPFPISRWFSLEGAYNYDLNVNKP